MKHCLDSELRLLGITFHQNPSTRVFKNAMSNDMNGTEDDILWEDDHEENSCMIKVFCHDATDVEAILGYDTA